MSRLQVCYSMQDYSFVSFSFSLKQNRQLAGAYDDPNGSHISIEVVSTKFEGKRAMQRQQMVYKAIWEELQGPVHAVDSMVCKTPDEA